jgi:hypothetical protein
MKFLQEMRRIEKPKLNVIDEIVKTALAMGNPASVGDRTNLVRAFDMFFRESLKADINSQNPEVVVLEMSRYTREIERAVAESTHQWQGSPTQVAVDFIRVLSVPTKLRNYDLSKLKEVLVKAKHGEDILYIMRFFDGDGDGDARDITMSLPRDMVIEFLETSQLLKEIG